MPVPSRSGPGRTTVSGDTDAAAEEDARAEHALAQAALLVVDDEPGMCNFLKRALQPRCALVEVAASAEQAEALRLRYHFDLLLVDIRLPGLSGLEWLSRLRERGVRTPVIYMTAYADLEMSIQALHHGAGDFVTKPFRTEAMLQAVRRSLMHRQPVQENALGRLKRELAAAERGVIGHSEAILDTLRLAQRVAPTPSTVLVQGETGTGKELIARTVHALSRRPGAFVALNCGSVPGELFESELFGHVRGAFSGAQSAREGLFVHADRGTLFLDEIAELPFDMQTRLLRVLEEGCVRPVGAEREQPVDVRVIAATHRDLAARVRDGRFREDLWFRLNVLPIRMPTLRERLDDLPLLVEHFNRQLSLRLGLEPFTLMHADHQRLRDWHWPGNVRELRNVIERALLLGRLEVGDQPEAASRTGAEGGPGQAGGPGAGPSNGSPGAGPREARDDVPGYPLDWPLEAVERAHMRAVLDSTGNNKSAAARILHVSRKTLERKQQQWNRAGSPPTDDAG